MATNEDDVPQWVEDDMKEHARQYRERIKDDPEKLAALKQSIKESEERQDYYEEQEIERAFTRQREEREDWEQYDGHKEDNLF